MLSRILLPDRVTATLLNSGAFAVCSCSCFLRSSQVVTETAVTWIFRCVTRDHRYPVRNGRLMTRHEQSVKAHEHTSNSSILMIILKTHEQSLKSHEQIPRENCS